MTMEVACFQTNPDHFSSNHDFLLFEGTKTVVNQSPNSSKTVVFIASGWTMFVGLPQLIFAGWKTLLAGYNTKWYYPKYYGLSSSIIKIPFLIKQYDGMAGWVDP